VAIGLLLVLGLAGAPSGVTAEPGANALEGEVLQVPVETPATTPTVSAQSVIGDEPDLASLVGLGLPEAFARFGPPLAVAALRGEQPWQDDVVFSYAGGLQLFWYRERVWQVRLDVRYDGRVYRLRMGSTRGRVLELMGPPSREEEQALVYHLEDRGYPVRLRFYFEEDRLVDLYCYRGDL
jgi:hypothetical protein